MCATINNSPDCASVATQVTSPSASNFGVKARPSSTSLVEPGAANADGLATSVSRAKNGCSALASALGSTLGSALAHQCHESNLLGRIVAERADELGRDRRGAELLHAAQRHAHVLGLEQDGDAAWIEDLVDRSRDLRSQALLRLQSPRIEIHKPRQLGEPDHTLDRLVGDMRLAHERHHVMLALGVEG